jgi:hypothetical protein
MMCSAKCISVQVRQVFYHFFALLCLRVVAEWMSGDRSQIITWTTTTNSDVVFHSVSLQNPTLFEEIATQQEWGTLHIAMKSVRGNGAICLSRLTVHDGIGW